MKFFESPFYQQDVIDLQTLQARVQELFVLMNIQEDNDVRVEFLHTLYAMIEKEQCLLCRLQLDGTKEAQEVMTDLHKNAVEAGMQPHHSLQTYHLEQKNNIKLELKELTGEDLDAEVEID